MSLCGLPHIARAQDDYDLEGTRWNGLSSFLNTVRDVGVRAQMPAKEVDLRTLSPSDALLLLQPTRHLPNASLSEFMRDGGRVAVFDDYGAGDAFLTAFGISRDEAIAKDAPRLRGNPNLPVARTAQPHPLNEGVGALVANHPTALQHRALQPIFAFDDSGRALLLAGQVGEGRLLVCGDPSVLINNMLQFRGNRRFAENLVRYLNPMGEGQLIIVGPNTRLAGHYGRATGDHPLEDLQVFFENLATTRLDGWALHLLAFIILFSSLWAGYLALPRRSPYQAQLLLPSAPHFGGTVGHRQFYAHGDRDQRAPLLTLKHEVEMALIERLDLQPGALLRDVLHHLEKRGVPADVVGRTRALFVGLDRLETQGGHKSRHISVNTLQQAVHQARTALEEIDRAMG